jgi:hypothetical protein
MRRVARTCAINARHKRASGILRGTRKLVTCHALSWRGAYLPTHVREGCSAGRRPPNPRIPPRPAPIWPGKWPGFSRSRLGRDRENTRDFAPIPIGPGSREIGESRFGRDRELAGICASINRDQDRDRDPGFHFLVVQFWDWSSRNAGFPPLGQRRNGTSTRSSS